MNWIEKKDIVVDYWHSQPLPRAPWRRNKKKTPSLFIVHESEQSQSGEKRNSEGLCNVQSLKFEPIVISKVFWCKIPVILVLGRILSAHRKLNSKISCTELRMIYHTRSMLHVHSICKTSDNSPHRVHLLWQKRMIIFSNAFAVYSLFTIYSWTRTELKIESNKLDTKGKPQIIFKWEVKSCSESVYIRLITPFNESVHYITYIYTLFFRRRPTLTTKIDGEYKMTKWYGVHIFRN